MNRIRRFALVANSIVWLESMFRICTNQAEAFDYVEVVFTSIILIVEICLRVRDRKKKKESVKDEEQIKG